MKTIRKAFKFRLNTKPSVEVKLNQFAGASRFVWNKALRMNLSRLENKQKILWKEELQFWLKLWKESDDYGWLKQCHSQALQAPIHALDQAFKDAFDKSQPLKRIPTIKKKSKSIGTIRYPQGFKIEQENNRMFFPKIGWITYRNSRKIVGTPKNVTLSKKGKYWFVSVQTEYEAMILPHQSTSMVGLDVGVNRFVTLSNGKFYEPLNSFRRKQAQVTKLQRKLKNKVKFSNNWKKQQRKIADLHSKIASARHDYLHKISSEISKNHAIVVVEDLAVKNMSKSAKGNIEKHGKKVKQKSGLNKSILDQGWSMFVGQLEYKQNWANGLVLKVDPKHSSQDCPCCGHRSKDNRKSQAEFVCVECGYSANADDVASVNIERRGHRQLACQASVVVMTPATGTILSALAA